MADDATEYMLTTVDNPFNPFTQYDEWANYDEQLGYHTPSLLARVAIVSDEMSELDQELAINQAIDDIVSENSLGLYRKITKSGQPFVGAGGTSQI